MLKLKNLTIAVVASVFVITSCSVEKRVHMTGYNVKFNKSYKVKDDVKTQNNLEKNVAEEVKTSKFQIKDRKSSEVIEMNEVAETTPTLFTNKASKKTSTNVNKTTPVNNKSKTEVKHQNTSSKKSNMATESFVTKKESTSSSSSKNSKDDTVKLVIALVLCFFLPPLAVWLAYGKGSEFSLNLWLFLGGFILAIVGVIMVFVSPFVGLALYVLGAIALLVAFIHSLVKVIQKLV